MNIFRSSTVPDLPGLKEYLTEIRNRFCPFLEPSEARSLTRYSVYELGSVDVEEVQELMFCLGFLHTEILRRKRWEVPVQHRPLVCENIFFRFKTEDSVNGSELFGWPHWLLKVRYTQAGVMYGKFWKGEEALSRDSVPIPLPPYHMLSIRGSVKKHDPAFFKKAPELLDTLIAADDNGKGVFDDIEDSDDLYKLAEFPGETAGELLAASRKVLDSFNLYKRLYSIESQKRGS